MRPVLIVFWVLIALSFIFMIVHEVYYECRTYEGEYGYREIRCWPDENILPKIKYFDSKYEEETKFGLDK